MQHSLDERWFKQLRDISNQFEESQWLQDHIRISHEERERFLDNEIENPRFRYKELSKKENSDELIDALRLDMRSSKVHAVVAELYEKKLRNQEMRQQMLQVSRIGDDAAFYSLSSQLYGKPKTRFFSYVASRVLVLCDQCEKEYPKEVKILRKVVSKIDTKVHDIEVGMLPDPVETGVPIESLEQVLQIFQSTLDRFDLSDWKLVVDDRTARSSFSVNPSQRIVFVPKAEQLLQRSRPLTDVQVQALAEHEIGVHARRTAEAEHTPLKLLQIGLDAYLMGEEGVASYVQQQIEGADEFYGFDRYFAACLAVGMDGVPRDFRAVFSIMTAFYTLKFAADNHAKVVPFRAAWNVCIRIFRGTTGQSTGCIYTKDIVYLEGNVGIWHLLSEKPHVFESLFVGKFNPLISRHVRSLQTLEILKEW